MAAFDSSQRPARSSGMPAAAGRPGLGVMAAAALVAAAALLPVVQNSNATSAGYETRRLERRKAALQAAIHSTQAEVAQLGSLERVDREARERLGMAAAAQMVVVQVTEPAPAGWEVPPRFLPQEDDPPRQAARSAVRALLAKLFIH